jgi:hypothetical protein
VYDNYDDDEDGDMEYDMMIGGSIFIQKKEKRWWDEEYRRETRDERCNLSLRKKKINWTGIKLKKNGIERDTERKRKI